MTTPSPHKRPAFEPAARLLRPPGYNPDMPRPASTVAGVVLVLLRVAAGVFVIAGLGTAWEEALDSASVTLDAVEATAEVIQVGFWIAVGFGVIAIALDALFALLIYRGHNWPRVFVMAIATISIATSFFAWWTIGDEITIEGTFLSLSLDILILLALSSRSAAAYARRNQRR